MTPLNTLKNWFRNGLKPTQEQFWAWMDSFRHKSEKIPLSDIENIEQTLANKADADALAFKADLVDGKVPLSQMPFADDVIDVSTFEDLPRPGDKKKLYKTDDGKVYSWKTSVNDYVLAGLDEARIAALEAGKVNEPTSDGSWVRQKLGSVFSWVNANDFGKNIANSFLTSVVNAGINFGAAWRIKTNGFNFNIEDLPSKSADATFDRMLVTDLNGLIGRSNGKTLFLNQPNNLTPAERNVWMAGMNNLVSYTGALVTQNVPPIIARNALPQNIVIRGNGLNLPENSYVGLIKPDGSDYNSSGYSIVGNNQEIIGTFLLDNNYPLGRSKIKILSGGVPAVGDVYLTVVENMVSIPFVGNVKTRDDISSVENILINNDTATLRADGNIYPIGDSSVPVSAFYTDDAFKGNEDWWITMKVKPEVLNSSASNTFTMKFGLVKNGLIQTSNPADTLIKSMILWSLYSQGGSLDSGYYGNIFDGNDSSAIRPFVNNNVTLQYIKIGSILTSIATFADGRSLIINQTIDTFSDYGVAFLQMNGISNAPKHTCQITSAYKLG